MQHFLLLCLLLTLLLLGDTGQARIRSVAASSQPCQFPDRLMTIAEMPEGMTCWTPQLALGRDAFDGYWLNTTMPVTPRGETGWLRMQVTRTLEGYRVRVRANAVTTLQQKEVEVDDPQAPPAGYVKIHQLEAVQ